MFRHFFGSGGDHALNSEQEDLVVMEFVHVNPYLTPIIDL